MALERVATGIQGLDELVNGGIPQGSTVLVCGGAGTGKTILCTQFLYNGVSKYNEPGVLVLLESHLKNIVWDVDSFNWDLRKYQDKGLLKIYRMRLDPSRSIRDELGVITQMVKETKAKRLVIDSTTAFAVWVREESNLRKTLYDFVDGLKELNVTTLMTAETKGDKTSFSAFGVEEFISDAVIALYFTPPNRSIFVRKMRGTAHNKNVHPMDITPNGIVVKSKDEVLWEALK